MPVALKDVSFGPMLEKNYEKALSLANRYSFINSNLFPQMSKEEQDLMMEFQGVCRKARKGLDKDDVYNDFPKFGEANMIQRMNPWNGIEGSCKHQLLLSICMAGMSGELEMAIAASGILVGNSLLHNPKRPDIQQKALEEIYAGKAVGGIGITEPNRGSDAVNMEMEAQIAENGDITYNGTKIYTTNGAVADYFTTYGVLDKSDPRRTMMLAMFKREDEGLGVTRLNIPALPAVGIGKIDYNNITVGPDRMVAPPGEGYKRLFRGLTPERITIIGSSIAGLWHTLATGTIFSQIRTQFGAPLFKYQGISNVLADLYARTSAYTAFAFQVADFYDKKVGNLIHKGEKPNPTDEGSVAILAAQGKYLTAKMANESAYEVTQLMGGRGMLAGTPAGEHFTRGEGVTRISEVVGGHRNIQLMIIQAGLKATTKMAIDSYIGKSKRSLKKGQTALTELTVGRAEKLLASDGDFIPAGEKAALENGLAKLKAAVETKNTIEMGAYAKALPKLVATAGKSAYKAKKAQKQ